MYPECRHVRPSGSTCRAAALAGSHWCFFHARLHQRQTIRHTHRLSDGRFAPVSHLDRGPREQSHPTLEEGSATEAAAHPSALQTIDYGTYPVGPTHAGAPENASLDLPPIEDTESIQLALIDVLQALAANQLDPKRAGLLLYGLQVASANAKHLDIPSFGVRTVTYTSDGIALAPQDYGWDLEDIQEEIDHADEEDDEEEE